MPSVYLDNNATTRPTDEVVAAVDEAQRELWANPSSVHRLGQLVRQRVELARSSVARLIGARDREVVFTSGGTESNNLALRGVLGAGFGVRGSGVAEKAEPAQLPSATPDTRHPTPPPLLITTRIEHSAIREPAADLVKQGVEVVYLPVSVDGLVDPASLRDALTQHAGVGRLTLVSIQWANNETGTIQPIGELAAISREHAAHAGARVLFHSDATQAVGKIPVDVKSCPIDLLTFAGHKLHGPKGAGVLFVRSGVRLRAQNIGGPQERERRGGTENTPAILGLGVAAQLAATFVHDAPRVAALTALRDRFERTLCARVPGAVVNCAGAPRLWNTSNIAFPRLEAEAVLLGLSERGVCASAGAACSSGSLEPSPVLLAMGIPETLAHGSVRFSLSRFTSDSEIDAALDAVPAVVERLAKVLPGLGARF